MQRFYAFFLGSLIVFTVLTHRSRLENEATLNVRHQAGEAQWAISYYASEGESTVLNSIQETHDGGFIATGYFYQNDPQEVYIWVIKLDSLGNILWQKNLDVG